MASAFSEKTPPAFNRNSDDYSKWRKKFEVWQAITDVAKEKQGGLLTLRLDDVTQEEIYEEVTTDELKAEDGATKVLNKLDGKFLKDKSLSAYETYEDFEKYKRPENVSITDYCAEFERRLAKVKAKGTQISTEVLAYRLIKSANVTASQEQLIKATIDKIDYDTMAKQLKKVFKGVNPSFQDTGSNIKEEPEDIIIPNDTLYGARYDQGYQGRSDRNRNNEGQDQGFDRNWDSYSAQKESFETQLKQTKVRGKNPLDMYGNVTRCSLCDSINHWRKYCPDRIKDHKTYSVESLDREYSDKQPNEDEFMYEVHSSNTLSENDIEHGTLSSDTIGVAVLDTGATKTVCGSIWLKQFTSTLCESDKKLITQCYSNKLFKFGGGSILSSRACVRFPAVIGVKKVRFKTEVVEGDLPLLISRESLKSVGANLDFRDDTIEFLGQKLSLNITNSGHYALPLGNKSKLQDENTNVPLPSKGRCESNFAASSKFEVEESGEEAPLNSIIERNLVENLQPEQNPGVKTGDSTVNEVSEEAEELVVVKIEDITVNEDPEEAEDLSLVEDSEEAEELAVVKLEDTTINEDLEKAEKSTLGEYPVEGVEEVALNEDSAEVVQELKEHTGEEEQEPTGNGGTSVDTDDVSSENEEDSDLEGSAVLSKEDTRASDRSTVKPKEAAGNSANIVKRKPGRPRKGGTVRSVTSSELKPGIMVKYKPVGEDHWVRSQLLSRAGKKAGKYGWEWNVTTTGGLTKVVDFKSGVSKWELVMSNSDSKEGDQALVAETDSKEENETLLTETEHLVKPSSCHIDYG